MDFERRRVLGAAGAGALSLALDPGGLVSRAVAQPATTVRIRRNISTLTGPQVAAFRAGVAAMKARPATDPTSWLFQANIHGTYDAVPQQFAEIWGSCQHGTFHFLSWHRMYLYLLERILRAASGSPAFTLPYWDYTNTAQRRLPAPFRSPATAANPLFVAQRRGSINAGDPVPASAVGTSQALASLRFASATGSGVSFGGQTVGAPAHFSGPPGFIESQPHNVMHVTIGGNSGWMSDPNLAARDPIFYIHHCNIDRLWNRWLALGQGRANPTGNAGWMSTKFVFYDENRQRIEMTGAQVLNSAQQLGYRYDDTPGFPPMTAGTPPTESAAVDVAPTRELARAARGTESALRLGTRASTLMLEPVTPGAVESAVESAARPGPVILSFDEVAYRRPVGLYYEVYVNRPAGAAGGPDSPYYAGNLAFFALGHSMEGGMMGGRLMLDVTAVLARQRRRRLWAGGAVRVDLVPQGVEEGTEAASVGPLVSIGSVRVLGR